MRAVFLCSLGLVISVRDADAAGPDVYYVDADGDGHGDPSVSRVAWFHPVGFTLRGDDCDDSDAGVYPGAVEICDAIDDDCDGRVDDRDPSREGGRLYYADPDGDRYGSGVGQQSCLPRPDWVAARGDCAPDDRRVHPGAVEECDGTDNDCDRLTDDDDPDVDGYLIRYWDEDGDGHGDSSTRMEWCIEEQGYVDASDDCDDTDPGVYTGAPEYCDGTDNDCDGTADDSVVYVDWYVDHDGDGYGLRSSTVNDCVEPTGYGLLPGDCDERSATTNPGAADDCGDAVDDDCDGVVDDCEVSAFDALLTIDNRSFDSYTNFAENVAVGDFDADGIADIAMGNYPGTENVGEVFVLQGPVTGRVVLGRPMIRISEVDAGTAFGRQVASGDLDGDGLDDLLIAAPWDDEQVFVFSGPIEHGVTAAHADATVSSALGAGDEIGDEMDVTADFDGDGWRDLVIGASGAGSAGVVYVESGALSGANALEADASYRFEGVSTHPIGLRDVDLGDVTGDGITELAIAEQGPAARVYVEEGGLASGTYDVDAAALATLAATDDVYFGWSLAAADYDGDGLGDLFVGAPWQVSGTGDRSGAVYGFAGPFAGTIDETSAIVTWEKSNRTSLGDGSTGVATGDVDGDGSADVLIATPFDGALAGAVFVQLGFTSGTVDVATLPALRPQADEDQLGSVVAAMSDWTGDGGDEIVVGAYTANDPYGANIGSFYVFASDDLH